MVCEESQKGRHTRQERSWSSQGSGNASCRERSHSARNCGRDRPQNLKRGSTICGGGESENTGRRSVQEAGLILTLRCSAKNVSKNNSLAVPREGEVNYFTGVLLIPTLILAAYMFHALSRIVILTTPPIHSP